MATATKPSLKTRYNDELLSALPDRAELMVKVALDKAAGTPDPADEHLLAAVQRLHESNPMLGLRGVRLGLLTPACSPCRCAPCARRPNGA